MARKRKTPTRQTDTSSDQSEPRTPWGRCFKQRRLRREQKQRDRQTRRETRRRARIRRRQRRRRITARGLAFLLLGIITCLIGALFVIIIGRPYPWQTVSDTLEVMRIDEQVDDHHARWQRLAVNHYIVDVFYRDYNWQTRCGPIQIEVQDEEIIDQSDVDEERWRPAETCDEIVQRLTIDESFDLIEETLDAFQPSTTQVDIQFNTDFGYPIFIQIDVYGPPFNDCCWQVSWENFQPID